MDPGYETLIETENLIWTMAVYLLHGGIVFLQTNLGAPDGATTSYSIAITDLEDRKRTKLSDWGYSDMAEIEICKLG